MKILAGLLVLGAGALAELGSVVRLQSTNAVVSAPHAALRTPISGVVDRAAPAVGTLVRQGDVLVRVHDPMASSLPVETLRIQMAQQRAKLAATEQRRAALLTFRTTLQARAEAHTRLLTARLNAEIEGAAAMRASTAVQRDQDRRDLSRRRQLIVDGVVSASDLEHTQAVWEAAAQVEIAQSAARRSLEVQRDSAAAGMFAEAGPNEASYAVQRRDEMSLRLGDLDETAANLQADLAHTIALAAATEADAARRTAHQVVAPSDMIVWRRGVQLGDVVNAGETVIDLVACDQSLIIAAIRQRDLDLIEVGGIATIRLTGESGDRHGRVLGTLAASEVDGDPRIAAVPPGDRTASAMALVELGPAPEGAVATPNGCAVGRTAQVMLPRHDMGPLRNLLDRIL
jgi:multidrug resistance efflux pump